MLKCVAKFYLFRINHLGSVSVKLRFLLHFPPDIHNELIHFLGAAVRQASISSVQKAKNYITIFYMSPNNVHIKHSSQIFRFVEI